jgi:hypothetical protein
MRSNEEKAFIAAMLTFFAGIEDEDEALRYHNSFLNTENYLDSIPYNLWYPLESLSTDELYDAFENQVDMLLAIFNN